MPPTDSVKGRFYTHGGEKYYSVTTLLNVLYKPLVPWASKLIAEYTVNNLDTVLSMAMKDKAAAIAHLKGIPSKNSGSAAGRGSDVHQAVADFLESLRTLSVGVPEDPAITPYLENFEEFLATFSPKILCSECTVFSHTFGYAGTLDLLCTINDETWIVDVKTGKGYYRDHALQLNAYGKADFILKDGEEIAMPRVTNAAVLHLRADGWDFIPARYDEKTFSVFLAAKKCWEFMNGDDDPFSPAKRT